MTIQRIAILSVHTSPLAQPGGKKVGGMNVYVRELSRVLGERGIVVDIFTRRTSPTDPKVDTSLGRNVRVVYIPAGPEQPLSPDEVFPYLSQFTAGVIKFATCKNANYDILYSHYWLSGWVAAKLKEAWGLPFVQMYHTLGHMKQRILSHEMVEPDMRIVMETRVAEWADRIIAATPAEQTQLRWLYRVKRRKIEIVPPGVNTEQFYPHEATRAQLGLEDVCHVLLFVGRIEPLKAVDTIIEAIGHIREQNDQLADSLCFAVIGGDLDDPNDAELTRLRTLSYELGLSHVVKFLGAKDQSLLPQYYAAATAVIMPSDYESFGMVALEAMASGTPVIATEVGGLAYLVVDNETGYHVPVREPGTLADRIITLISDASKRKQMGQNASEYARAYAWPRIADRVLDVFEDVLDERIRRRRADV